MHTLTTQSFVRNVKAGRIRSVLPMIAKKARATWQKLPHSEQSVKSVADLMQEGIAFTVTHAAYEFDIRKGVKFTTFLFGALDNFYIDIIREAYAEKRLAPHGLLSLDSSRTTLASGLSLNLYTKLKLTRISKTDTETRLINRIDAHEGFMRAYKRASPRLRRYMIRWLLQPTPGRLKPGTDFAAAKREFRRVVRPYLTEELCDTIQRDWICRNRIAESVALTFETKKRETRSGFLNTEEFAVAPIISLEAAYKLMPTIG